MYSSAECRQWIAKYQEVVRKINALSVLLDSCSEEVSKGIPYMESLILSGEPIDYGKLSEISGQLSTVGNYFDRIVSECGDYISLWGQRLQEALAREAEEARVRKLTAMEERV